jgi:hypothetical protein
MATAILEDAGLQSIEWFKRAVEKTAWALGRLPREAALQFSDL